MKSNPEELFVTKTKSHKSLAGFVPGCARVSRPHKITAKVPLNRGVRESEHINGKSSNMRTLSVRFIARTLPVMQPFSRFSQFYLGEGRKKGLHGGGGSLERTVLRPIPCQQGKNRDIFLVLPRNSPENLAIIVDLHELSPLL